MKRCLSRYLRRGIAGSRRNARRGLAGAALLAGVLILTGCAALQPVWAPRQPKFRPPAQAGPAETQPKDPASLLRRAQSPARPVGGPTLREQMVDIQKLLAAKGYDPGPADGLYGARTATAIARYRRDRGLSENMATRDLLAHLRGVARPEAPKLSTAGLRVLPVEAAARSIYEPGDHYVYSNGEVHSVIRVDPDSVTWRVSGSETYTTPHAAGLPRLNWRDGVWRGRASFDRDSASPWPPAEGMELTFDVRTEEWNEEDSGERLVMESRWICRGEGRGPLETMAGHFDVDIFFCERSPAPAGAWQKRYWYFAPSVGHNILIDDRDGAGISLGRRELVAVLPGGKDWQPAIRTGLGRAIQNALNNRPAGGATGWQSPVSPDRFVIEVTKDFKGPGGKPCRSYTVTRIRESGRRLYPAIACKEAKSNRWVVPGAE